MLYQHRTAVRGLKYFSRPPWRSYLFLGNTLFLFMVTLFPIEIIMDFRLVRLFPIQIVTNSRSANGSMFWMFAPVAALVVLWGRVWKAHSDVYEAIHSNSVEKLSDDARIAVPLDALASMLYRSFGLAMFAVALAYAVTEDFVKASLHR
jgi:hypothetical protein